MNLTQEFGNIVNGLESYNTQIINFNTKLDSYFNTIGSPDLVNSVNEQFNPQILDIFWVSSLLFVLIIISYYIYFIYKNNSQ